MISYNKAAAVAALMLGASQTALHAQAAPAAPAAASTGIVAQGIGVVNIEAVRANSNAVKLADQQRETTYKATIDAARTRAQQIDTQLKSMAAKILLQTHMNFCSAHWALARQSQFKCMPRKKATI